jgi:hypothetical protein
MRLAPQIDLDQSALYRRCHFMLAFFTPSAGASSAAIRRNPKKGQVIALTSPRTRVVKSRCWFIWPRGSLAQIDLSDIG